MNPDAVRPGTSDALTARTIDATQYSPLVRAQETAVALVPRLAQAAVPLSEEAREFALALGLAPVALVAPELASDSMEPTAAAKTLTT